MKLFILLIPFLGVHCICAACFQKTNVSKPVEKKEATTYQMLPANLLFQFN
ncbi:MAG: hypothetical protein ACTHOF_00590 [Flavisolibacter sp.]|jgi:hypothetical protein